jgi:hypothetical protein
MGLACSSSIAVRDRMVADLYSSLLDTALESTAVKAVVALGFVDRHMRLNPRSYRQFVLSVGQRSRP